MDEIFTMIRVVKEWVWMITLACFAALAPIHPIMLVVGILIFADLFLGVWAAKKRLQQITSRRLRDSVSKLVIYQTAVITAYLMEVHLTGGAIPAVKIAGSLIGIVEYKSLLENGNAILGKPVFGFLINKLGSRSEK